MNTIYNKILAVLVFSFLLIPLINDLRAQTPGGTSLNMELWLSADKVQTVLPSDGADINQWNDISGKGRNFGKYGSEAVPRIKYNSMNFHPGIEFYTDAEDDGYGTTAERRRKLGSGSNFPVEASKAYYSFWVSRLSSSSQGSYAAVFSYNYGRGDDDGWNSNGNNKIWHTTRGTNYVHNYETNASGIGTAIRPNNTSIPQQQYYNGLSRTANITGRLMYNATGRPAIIGNSNETTGDYFYGDIMEIIVLTESAGSTISTQDLNKVHSYLAIKYGITLLSNDYVNSDNSIIWSRLANSGYDKNIFGIGRDDSGNLNQKQSASDNGGTFTIFIGNDLAETNADNNTTFSTDKHFLLLGTNGLNDIKEYKYLPGTQYLENKTTTEEMNTRQELVYKAQVTSGGLSSNMTVNIKTGGLYVLVSPNDPDFSPANTRIYQIEDGIAKDVVVNDGDYLCIGYYDRAPGGVASKMKLWLRADDESSLIRSGNNISAWNDLTSFGNDYTYAAVTGYSAKGYPTYVECDPNMNFQPSVSFEQNQWLAIPKGPMSTDAPDEFTSFVVYYAKNYANNGRLYTHGFGSPRVTNTTSRYPAMGFAPDDGVGRFRNNGAGQTNVDGNLRGFYKNTTALQMINSHRAKGVNGAGYAIHDFGGYQDKVTATGRFGDGFMMASGGTLGGASLYSGSFQGQIAEVFFYERALDEIEQDKVRTYLGIKYAITLDKNLDNDAIGYKYVLSDGTVVWDGDNTPGVDFHRNVAGLVRDDDSDLFINKAKSSADGACITMMVPGHTECGQGIEAELKENNHSGIFWGNDGGNQMITYTFEECFEFTERTSRVWLAKKTNLSNTPIVIRVGDGFPGFSGYINQYSQAYLLVADNAADFASKTWKMTIPGSFIDGEHQFEYIFDQEYTYFSIGFRRDNAFCETCSFKGEDAFSFTKGTIGGSRIRLSGSTNTYNLNNVYSENGNVNLDIKFEKGSGVNNMTIRPLSGGRARLQASGAANAISRITYELAEPADVSFAIGDIDRNEIMEVYGICDGEIIRPTFVYRESLSGLSKSQQKNGYTFDIVNISKAVGNGKSCPNGQNNRNNIRGKMHIQFGFPVEKIVIEYTSTKSGPRYFDLYPMKFSCPQPLPQPNEAGYAMQKRGPLEAHVCEIIDYSFIMLNANANCDMSRVCFSDTLPEGMYWVPGSLVMDESLLDRTIEAKGLPSVIMDERILRIDSLILKGDGNITMIRASAAFKDDATIDMTYYNQSQIDYVRKDNGKDESLRSTDVFYTSGDDRRTPTYVKNEVRDFFGITSTVLVKPSACFRENNEIEVTIEVNNPNTITLDDMFIEMGYNDNFNFIDLLGSSFRINGTVPSGIKMYIQKDEDNDPMPGWAMVEGFKLPPGTTTISYKVKAPIKTDLEVEIDPVTLEEYYYPLDLDYDLYTDMDAGLCVQNAFLDAGGFYELPYCSGKTHIITNKHVTTRIKR